MLDGLPMPSYKRFLASRARNGAVECLASLVEKEALFPEEIEGIKAFLEKIVSAPVYQSGIRKSNRCSITIPRTLALIAQRGGDSAE